MSQNVLQPSVSWSHAVASAAASLVKGAIRLPNLCHMMRCGQMRYIQTVYESKERQNPDRLVHRFLTGYQRLICHLRAKMQLATLRSQPFYYYLLARTRYYDQFFLSAIDQKADWIINIGCGSDTRGHRFSAQLASQGTRVLECDQPDAIAAKQRLAKKRWPDDPVEYLAIDLNKPSWPAFEKWLAAHPNSKIQVMLEGVSPYITIETFTRFLALLSAHQTPGARMAYDYKRKGRESHLDQRAEIDRLFSFGCDPAPIADFHQKLGYHVTRLETSEAMSCRLVPGLQELGTKLYTEDGLVVIER